MKATSISRYFVLLYFYSQFDDTRGKYPTNRPTSIRAMQSAECTRDIFNDVQTVNLAK
jgi:hypothetical protein